MMDIPSIAEAGAAIAAGRLSPVAPTEACLARIDQHEKRVHSFIRLERDRALGAARTAEAEIKAGRRRGDLHGIPFAYKDIYQTAGIPTTAHSKLLIEHLPTCDATTVTKLGEAGVVSFGKLATHEFAIGGPSFDLPFPPPCNPWSIEHFTGGSSSGTGAAVAAGFVLGGTGSDTGGSIRTPSAFCGLAGIKPTYGLVSRAGILPLSFTLDHAGPMAWTVEDCAILLQAMVGHDRADPASANLPYPRLSGQARRRHQGYQHWRAPPLLRERHHRHPRGRRGNGSFDQHPEPSRGLGARRDVTAAAGLAGLLHDHHAR